MDSKSNMVPLCRYKLYNTREEARQASLDFIDEYIALLNKYGPVGNAAAVVMAYGGTYDDLNTSEFGVHATCGGSDVGVEMSMQALAERAIEFLNTPTPPDIAEAYDFADTIEDNG